MHIKKYTKSCIEKYLGNLWGVPLALATGSAVVAVATTFVSLRNF
jgi:hypothetical protein